jgi:XRE family transcriptional regulator, master regulator for biofilm formation
LIGDIIKALRKSKDISISKLSETSGVAKSYLSFIEKNNKANPSIIIIEKIARALEVPVSSLVSENKYRINSSSAKEDLAKELLELDISREEVTECLRQLRERKG